MYLIVKCPPRDPWLCWYTLILGVWDILSESLIWIEMNCSTTKDAYWARRKLWRISACCGSRCRCFSWTWTSFDLFQEIRKMYILPSRNTLSFEMKLWEIEETAPGLRSRPRVPLVAILRGNLKKKHRLQIVVQFVVVVRLIYFKWITLTVRAYGITSLKRLLQKTVFSHWSRAGLH